MMQAICIYMYMSYNDVLMMQAIHNAGVGVFWAVTYEVRQLCLQKLNEAASVRISHL